MPPGIFKVQKFLQSKIVAPNTQAPLQRLRRVAAAEAELSESRKIAFQAFQRDFARTRYNPTAVATPPPAKNQMARSVGELVNTREISDAVDCDSLKPKISNNKPATSRATPNALFITIGGFTPNDCR